MYNCKYLLHIFFFSGLRSEGSDMSWKITVKTVKVEYGDQQRTDAAIRSRKSIQVSYQLLCDNHTQNCSQVLYFPLHMLAINKTVR